MISIIVTPDLSITSLIFVREYLFLCWGVCALHKVFWICWYSWIVTLGEFHLGVLSLWRVLMSEMLSLDLLCSPYSIPSPRRCDPISFSTQITQSIQPAVRQISKSAGIYRKDAKSSFFRSNLLNFFPLDLIFFFRERTNPLCVHSHRLYYIANCLYNVCYNKCYVCRVSAVWLMESRWFFFLLLLFCEWKNENCRHKNRSALLSGLELLMNMNCTYNRLCGWFSLRFSFSSLLIAFCVTFYQFLARHT